MRWHLLAIGKPKLDFARLGIEEYARRLAAFVPVRLDFLKARDREEESAILLEKSAGKFRVALDERGHQLGSRAFAEQISKWEIDSKREVAVLIGGAEGHAKELLAAVDWSWSLSTLTLQHELALLFALEQIYRAYTIKSGLPYHRE